MFPVCAMRCCDLDRRPVMTPRLLELRSGGKGSLLVYQMFSPQLVFEISFESILGFQCFGAEENYLSIFTENASAYVTVPHKDAYFLFETPYHMASRISTLYLQLRKEMDEGRNVSRERLIEEGVGREKRRSKGEGIGEREREEMEGERRGSKEVEKGNGEEKEEEGAEQKREEMKGD